MNKVRHLSLDEIKKIQLEMLIDLDKFCREHNITYFLSYGTLLGAIRHKGYIPWDDDIDVMVPRPQIINLVDLYNRIRSKQYRILDPRNDSNYDMPYPRMVDLETFNKIGVSAYNYGVNIDIYPIDAFPNSNEEIEKYRKKINKIKRIRLGLIKLRDKILKIFPMTKFPLVSYLSNKQSKIVSSYDYETSEFVHVCSYFHTPFPKSIFDKSVEVEFEGMKFLAPHDWHHFLETYYGNYMKLPPIEMRKPYHRNSTIYHK